MLQRPASHSKLNLARLKKGEKITIGNVIVILSPDDIVQFPGFSGHVAKTVLYL